METIIETSKKNTKDETTVTLSEMYSKEFDEVTIFTSNSDDVCHIMVIPSYNEDYENTLLYINVDGDTLERVDKDNWNLKEKFVQDKETEFTIRFKQD